MLTTTQYLSLASVLLLVLASLSARACDCTNIKNAHCYTASVGADIPGDITVDGNVTLTMDSSGAFITLMGIDLAAGTIKSFSASVPIKSIGIANFTPPITFFMKEGQVITPGSGALSTVVICYDASLLITMCCPPVAHYDLQYTWDVSVHGPDNCTEIPICQAQNITINPYISLTRTVKDVNILLTGEFFIINPDCCAVRINKADIKAKIGDTPLTVSCPPTPCTTGCKKNQGAQSQIILGSRQSIECTFSLPKTCNASHPTGVITIVVPTAPTCGCQVAGAELVKPVTWNEHQSFGKCAAVTVTATTTSDNDVKIFGVPKNPICSPDDLPDITAQIFVKDFGSKAINFAVTVKSDLPQTVKKSFVLPICGINPGHVDVVLDQTINATYDEQYHWDLLEKPVPNCTDGDVCAPEGIDVTISDFFGVAQTSKKVNYQLHGAFTVTNPECVPAKISDIIVKVGDQKLTFACTPSLAFPLPTNATLKCTFEGHFGENPPAGPVTIQVLTSTPEVEGIEVTGDEPISDDTWKLDNLLDECMGITVTAVALPGVVITDISNKVQPQICNESALAAVIAHALVSAIGPTAVTFTVKMDWVVDQTKVIVVNFCGLHPGTVDILVAPVLCGKYDWQFHWSFENKTVPECINGDICNETTAQITDFFALVATHEEVHHTVTGKFVIINPECVPVKVTGAHATLGDVDLVIGCTFPLVIPAGANATCLFSGIFPEGRPVPTIKVVVETDTPEVLGASFENANVTIDWTRMNKLGNTVTIKITAPGITIDNFTQTVVADDEDNAPFTKVAVAHVPIKVVGPTLIDFKVEMSDGQILVIPVNFCGINPGHLNVSVCPLHGLFDWKFTWTIVPKEIPACVNGTICGEATAILSQYFELTPAHTPVNYRMCGQFKIINPTCVPAQLGPVAMTIGGVAVVVTCPATPVGPNGGMVQCSFTGDFDNTKPADETHVEVQSVTPEVLGTTYDDTNPITWTKSKKFDDCVNITVGPAEAVIDNRAQKVCSDDNDVAVIPKPIVVHVPITAVGPVPQNYEVEIVGGETLPLVVNFCGINPGHVDVVVPELCGKYDWQYSWNFVNKTIPTCVNGDICDEATAKLSDYFAVKPTYDEVNHRITGTFTIRNTNCVDAQITAAEMTIADVPMIVECNLPVLVPAHGSVQCNFSGTFSAGRPPSPSAIKIDLTSATPEVEGIEYSGTKVIGWHLDQKIADCVNITIAPSVDMPEIIIENPDQTICASNPVVAVIFAHVPIKVVGPTLIVFRVVMTDGEKTIDLPVNFCGINPGHVQVGLEGALTATYDRNYTWKFIPKVQTCVPEELCDAEGVDVDLTKYFDIKQTSTPVNYQVAGKIKVTNPECVPVSICGITVTIGTTLVEEISTLPKTIEANDSMLFDFAGAFGATPVSGVLKVDVKSCTPEVLGVIYNGPTVTPSTYVASGVEIGKCIDLSVVAGALPDGVVIQGDITNKDQTNICQPSDLTSIVAHFILSALHVTVPFTATMTNGAIIDFDVELCGQGQGKMSITGILLSNGIHHTTFDWDVTATAHGPGKCVNLTSGDIGTSCLSAFVAIHRTPRTIDEYYILDGAFKITNDDNYCQALIASVEVRFGGGLLNYSCDGDLTLPLAPNASIACTFTTGRLPTKPTGQINIKVTPTAESLVLGDSESIAIPDSADFWRTDQVNFCVLIGVTLDQAVEYCANASVGCINVTEIVSPNSTSELCFNYTVKAWQDTANPVLLAESDVITVCYCPPVFGCVFTMGYWKHHCCKWPVGYANRTFFNSSHTWWTAMNHKNAPRMCYWRLAQEYIAAELNIANGASHSSIDDTLEKLEEWFINFDGEYCKKECCDAQLLQYYHIIWMYNEGKGELPACCPPVYDPCKW